MAKIRFFDDKKMIIVNSDGVSSSHPVTRLNAVFQLLDTNYASKIF